MEFQCNELDILCGRGGKTNNHKGNRIFRRLIVSRKELYHSLSDEHKKFLLVKSIYLATRKAKMRFLNQAWEEINEKDALRKVAQALRENRKAVHTREDVELLMKKNRSDKRDRERLSNRSSLFYSDPDVPNHHNMHNSGFRDEEGIATGQSAQREHNLGILPWSTSSSTRTKPRVSGTVRRTYSPETQLCEADGKREYVPKGEKEADHGANLETFCDKAEDATECVDMKTICSRNNNGLQALSRKAVAPIPISPHTDENEEGQDVNKVNDEEMPSHRFDQSGSWIGEVSVRRFCNPDPVSFLEENNRKIRMEAYSAQFFVWNGLDDMPFTAVDERPDKMESLCQPVECYFEGIHDFQEEKCLDFIPPLQRDILGSAGDESNSLQSSIAEELFSV